MARTPPLLLLLFLTSLLSCTTNQETDPAPVYSAVERTEEVSYEENRRRESDRAAVRGTTDVSYGQIVIGPNRAREFPAEPEVVYSLLKPTIPPSHQSNQ
ncbi:hypothetical protein PFLUV_G00170710 [Perca fluviatilis]|uniref:Uncharacterized protein n=1 Tax=Perca fluviatilis TaxID=8168 RepID=A0A6A5EZE5_PERFL|nr:hypothetical protein PFLUV_G00170710 [Perca fluviatilis]